MDAHNLQDSPKTFGNLMDLFETGHQEVDADRDPDLRLDGVLAGPEERFDAQVLLDPLEEQLDVPAALVERGDGGGREPEMVGQKDEDLAGFQVAEADSSQLGRVELLAAGSFEADNLVTPQTAGSVDRAGFNDIETEVGFGPHHEVGLCVVQPVQSGEVNVSTIHDIDAPRLGADLIEDVDVMHAPFGDADKHWDRAAQIDHRVHLDGGFGGTKIGPRKQRQAQIDGRRIQGVNHLVDLQVAVIPAVEPTRLANEHLGQGRENPPVPKLVGIGQIGPRHRPPNAHCVKVTRAPQACLDVAQPFPKSHLREGHGQELIPPGETPAGPGHRIDLQASIQLFAVNQVHDLGED